MRLHAPGGAASATSAEPLAERRADVDDAVVLDRHEWSAEIHDHALDGGEDLVAGLERIGGARDLDADFVHRASFDSLVLEQLQKPVAIGNPRGLDLNCGFCCCWGHACLHF